MQAVLRNPPSGQNHTQQVEWVDQWLGALGVGVEVMLETEVEASDMVGAEGRGRKLVLGQVE